VSWGENSLKVLPADPEPRVVAKALSRDFPGTQTAPIESVVQFARPAASSAAARSGELAGYASRLAGIPGVQAGRLTGVRDGIALVELRYRYDPISAAARQIVLAARGIVPPAGGRAYIDGSGSRDSQVEQRTRERHATEDGRQCAKWMNAPIGLGYPG
jgi:hypothetical protein